MTPTEWILAGASIAQVVITIGLVYYAAVTIREAKNDRRMAAIERWLERIYFPMFDILDRARHENAGRTHERRQSVPRGDKQEASEQWAYVLTEEELAQIRDMIQRFGYYLDPTELARLRADLETAFLPMSTAAREDIEATFHTKLSPYWVRLQTNIFDSHWRFFKSQSDKLTAELEKLTGVKGD